MPYTEDELAALSPTERAALEAPDEDEDTLADLAGDDNDDSDADSDDDDDDGKSDDKKDDKAAEDKSADGDKSDGKNVAGDDKAADVIIDPVADLDVEIEDIAPIPFKAVFSADLSDENQAKIDVLDERLDAGEISQAEYRKLERKIIGENLEGVNAAIEWEAEKSAYLKAATPYKTLGEYMEKDPAGYAKFNAEVVRIANSGKALTGIQVLYAAKQSIDEAADFAAFRKARKEGKTVEAAAAAIPKKDVPAKPAAKRPDHQTLRDVPAADQQDVGADKFAYLDKLSGLALEAAVSKLSTADYAAYTSGT
jgi:hypothetical protein